MVAVLCIHGVGHEEKDPAFRAGWTKAITDGLRTWDAGLEIEVDFFDYDDLFEQNDLNPVTYAAAFAELLASGVVHSVGDLFSRERGLFELPEQIRWTAGMVAQWATEDSLRQQTRDSLRAKLATKKYDVVCAHSLGSLVSYDTFIHHPEAVANQYFVSFGSQIGNPCVRNVFAGRIEPLPAARQWFHLYNPEDHVLTAPLHIAAANFTEVGTDFDKPNDMLNHDATWYLSHPNTRDQVWRTVSGVAASKAMTNSARAFAQLAAKPNRRALLIGINNYPDPANRLEGCVNDVFLMSSVLQESGFAPQDIRVVLDERATTAGIMERLHWLLDGAQAGDERVLFYSGHGAQIPGFGTSDEADHLNECLVPWDFDWNPAHAITDKQFYALYSQLPYDMRFVAILDCCHSGGMTRDGSRRVRGITPPDDIRHLNLCWNSKLQMWQERTLAPARVALGDGQETESYVGANRAVHRLGRAVNLRSHDKEHYDALRKTLGHHGPYLPILLEACKEEQFSYEYRHGVTSYGAFTYCLAQILRESRQKGKNLTFKQLSSLTSARLKTLKYQQTPCLIGPSDQLSQEIPWKK